MCAFIVLGLVFPYQAKRLAGERLRNGIFCVTCDVQPELSQSIPWVQWHCWLDDRKGISPI